MDYYAGEIRMFAGPNVPEGWVPCDGRTLNINDYQILYALLGTTWGGNGTTTFGIPDLRGRLPMGQGQGPGLTMRNRGQMLGTETVALTEAQMPAHTHTLNATTAVATSVTPGPGLLHADPADPARAYFAPTAPITNLTLEDPTIGNQGGGQPHSNLMPTSVVTFMMATNGLYPVQP
ncbi:tail fiber protein [Brevundimonas vitis]|uniref:Tail fiber protein n=1 Tax=Brevundimonas vitisensis TaxID=2800818 RepID=A0ABX7BRW8_9CAUL|nr:tail fiber protein [Brevundimonas vitisensis]QQQ19473.1 tail fiber protein [Brevundimonas vitisensis]